jgi:hypothetical protein
MTPAGWRSPKWVTVGEIVTASLFAISWTIDVAGLRPDFQTSSLMFVAFVAFFGLAITDKLMLHQRIRDLESRAAELEIQFDPAQPQRAAEGNYYCFEILNHGPAMAENVRAELLSVQPNEIESYVTFPAPMSDGETYFAGMTINKGQSVRVYLINSQRSTYAGSGDRISIHVNTDMPIAFEPKTTAQRYQCAVRLTGGNAEPRTRNFVFWLDSESTLRIYASD